MRRFRFSLRTLVCFALLCGSGVALWRNSASWVVERRLAINLPSRSAFFRFSSDGKRIAGTDRSDNVRVMECDTGHLISEMNVKLVPLMFVQDMCFSLDSKFLVTTQTTHNRIWDVASGRSMVELENLNSQTPDSLQFTADGKRVVSSNSFQAWDASSGELLMNFGYYYNNSKNDPELASAEFNQKMIERDTKWIQAKTLDEFSRTIHEDDPVKEDVDSLFTLDSYLDSRGRLLTHFDRLPNCQIWSLETGLKLSDFETPAGPLDVAFSPDGGRIALWSDTKMEASIRDARMGSRICTIRAPDAVKNSIEQKFSEHGNLLGMYMGHSLVSVCNANNGELRFSVKIDDIQIDRIAFSKDEERVFVSTKDGLKVVDARDGRTLDWFRMSDSDETEQVSTSVLSPDGETLATDGPDGCILLWRRNRPEWWWGLAWLPEFWVTLVCAAAVIWSVRREFRGARSA